MESHTQVAVTFSIKFNFGVVLGTHAVGAHFLKQAESHVNLIIHVQT